jgi:hypothetical protein
VYIEVDWGSDQDAPSCTLGSTSGTYSNLVIAKDLEDQLPEDSATNPIQYFHISFEFTTHVTNTGYALVINPDRDNGQNTIHHAESSIVEVGSETTQMTTIGPTGATSESRGQDDLWYESEGNFPADGNDFMVECEWTPTYNNPDVAGFLWTVYQGADDWIGVLRTGTNIVARKRIGGVSYNAQIAIGTPTLGQTYKIKAVFPRVGEGHYVELDGVASPAVNVFDLPILDDRIRINAKTSSTQPGYGCVRNFVIKALNNPKPLANRWIMDGDGSRYVTLDNSITLTGEFEIEFDFIAQEDGSLFVQRFMGEETSPACALYWNQGADKFQIVGDGGAAVDLTDADADWPDGTALHVKIVRDASDNLTCEIHGFDYTATVTPNMTEDFIIETFFHGGTTPAGMPAGGTMGNIRVLDIVSGNEYNWAVDDRKYDESFWCSFDDDVYLTHSDWNISGAGDSLFVDITYHGTSGAILATSAAPTDGFYLNFPGNGYTVQWVTTPGGDKIISSFTDPGPEYLDERWTSEVIFLADDLRFKLNFNGGTGPIDVLASEAPIPVTDPPDFADPNMDIGLIGTYTLSTGDHEIHNIIYTDADDITLSRDYRFNEGPGATTVIDYGPAAQHATIVNGVDSSWTTGQVKCFDSNGVEVVAQKGRWSNAQGWFLNEIDSGQLRFQNGESMQFFNGDVMEYN